MAVTIVRPPDDAKGINTVIGTYSLAQDVSKQIQ
jgi:hypothetical protein